MITLGDVVLSSSCVLAPLSGISDLPFRMIHRSFGCELSFAEMISARSLVYQSRKTEEMLSTIPGDSPLGVQMLGADPQVMERALERLREYDFDVVDINAACPVGKVTKRGEGASLLKEPRKLRDLLKAAVRNSPWPVTVKIRTGWDEDSVNARDVALHAQDAGVQGLFIHGRTKSQGYGGSVDYRVIGEVKDALTIPVIASGDVFSPRLIRKILDETGCDGVAIARGALGNPWIFAETAEFLKYGTMPERPGLAEITRTMIKHLDSCVEFYGERIGTMVFRKYFAWYIRGIAASKHLKERAFRAKTRAEMHCTIQGLHRADAEDSAGFAFR